ncbi:MAG: acyl carrier protein phosphodiesterase [Cyclobacteriaceae bacterium]|jgi:acyl carrier protein phosphodiesterase
MNFLAHLYLSFDDEDLMVGNFIGDFVKGKEIDSFNQSIRKGIVLHRKIDEFTDTHPVVMESKVRLRPQFSHYSPVISDMFFDHFLAKSWHNYHSTTLKEYTQAFYQLTKNYQDILPAKAANLLKYMSAGDWLYNYQHISGIHEALSGMARRTNFESKMELASVELEKNYTSYETEFLLFFPDLITECKQLIKTL